MLVGTAGDAGDDVAEAGVDVGDEAGAGTVVDVGARDDGAVLISNVGDWSLTGLECSTITSSDSVLALLGAGSGTSVTSSCVSFLGLPLPLLGDDSTSSPSLTESGGNSLKEILSLNDTDSFLGTEFVFLRQGLSGLDNFTSTRLVLSSGLPDAWSCFRGLGSLLLDEGDLASLDGFLDLGVVLNPTPPP